MPTKPAAKRKRKPRPDPNDVLNRALARAIAAEIRAQKMNQTEAARVMMDAPSQVSLVMGGKLRGFSTLRLIRMLNKLGKNVDLKLSKSPKGRGRTRLVSA